jgi:hypothetical protein
MLLIPIFYAVNSKLLLYEFTYINAPSFEDIMFDICTLVILIMLLSVLKVWILIIPLEEVD